MNGSKTLKFKKRILLLILFLMAAMAACTAVSNRMADSGDSSAKLHLGNHIFPISTNSQEAQAAFNTGLTLTYGFSHVAAEREFRRAAKLDPNAAMPWWGVALVNGPHINYPIVPEARAKVAWEALTQAKQRISTASPLEQELINALSSRYVEKQPSDRSSLDKAYAASMKKVWLRHPTNADIATLYAESLMDLHPWDLFDNKGVAKPWTPEIIQTIEGAMKLNPVHPGAHHLYIHAVEASNLPERGLRSADLLGTLVPGSGHLVHMPAHIYLRVGQWPKAAKSNEDAIVADREFTKIYPNQGFYALYMLHNRHFLTFVHMMQGRKEDALKISRDMIATVPEDFLRDYGAVADGFMALTLEVLMRFGEWEAILKEPAPSNNQPFARSMWRFVRSSAYTALDKPVEAKAEKELFLAAVREVPADATFGNNEAHKLLKIAQNVLDGEMAARANKFDQAIKFLNAAITIEDTLLYDEPPDWILPVRHSMGITLLRAGKPREAELVYREDLHKFPKNGWSLYGLSRALHLQGDENGAAQVMREFKDEWAMADTTIGASCLCQPSV